MRPNFVHLNIHSQYSLVDGLVRVKPLVKACSDQDMSAVAVTDVANLFVTVKFYQAALNAGVKPIIGAELYVYREEHPNDPFRLIALCQNPTGYHHLTLLVSKAYTHGQRHGYAQIDKSWLWEHNEGLILLSGASKGDIAAALLQEDDALTNTLVEEYQQYFPDRFYLELQRVGLSGEALYLEKALSLAEEKQLPVVATNAVRFITADDYEAHEARVCIHQGMTLDDSRRPRDYTEEQYLKSPEQMQALFSDIPEALANTVAIAERCSTPLSLGTPCLPNFPVPDGMSVEEYLVKVSEDGLAARLDFLFPEPEQREQKRPEYEARLKEELDVINAMGFPGYFLIVADFIQWAKENGVPVGPGRGSGAGSLVAYALLITDLDPIAYDLLFERFLNPERVSMPDFDVDFCMEGRDSVIEYVANRYGRESVSQIITYGSMAAKAVIRDVGRVLGHPYGFVDKIAKLIPFEVGITLSKAMEQEEALQERYDNEEEVKTLIDLALKLEGITRNVGKHAGGVVISPSALTDFTPIYCEPGETAYVAQFDKDDVEAVGLVKFDFLGLRNLTIIDWALKIINQDLSEAEKIDINQIPLDDTATFDLLKAATTTAVFQLESRGMKDLIKRLQPDCFEDIVALVALFRPGPLQSGMVDDFINRKHGRAKVEYPHPDLEPILKPTYGVILYQEQVMQIAQKLANYTLGGADLLRRAMGKKKPEEMAKQRVMFMEGAVARGVEEDTATYIFDLMEKFAGYGFNKSHSAAYALVSYQTAWLKTHYPAAFMAAVLSSDMDNTDKVVGLIEECRAIGLQVEPPDINRCAYRFTVANDACCVYGIGAIKGVGEAAIENILQARQEDGEFGDLFEICKRVDLRKVNKRVFEALIRSGALDNLGHERAVLAATLERAMAWADKANQDKAIGQDDLFASVDDASTKPEYVAAKTWSERERLQAEKETLGLYLTGHPINRYLKEIQSMTRAPIAEIKPTARGKTTTVAGLVVALRVMRTKKGDKMAFVTLDDRTARLEIAVFAKDFTLYQHLLEKDKILIIEGEVSIDEYSGGYRMRAKKITPIMEARRERLKALRLSLQEEKVTGDFIQQLQQAFAPYREGKCPVAVYYQRPDVTAKLNFGEAWHVDPHDDLLDELRYLVGQDNLELCYS